MRSVRTPAATPSTAGTRDQAVLSSGLTVVAATPSSPKTPMPADATATDRRRPTTPRTAPKANASTTVPMTSAVFSLVPNRAIAISLTREPAPSSTTPLPIATTRDGADGRRPATSSVVPSATAAATSPATAGRPSPSDGMGEGVVPSAGMPAGSTSWWVAVIVSFNDRW